MLLSIIIPSYKASNALKNNVPGLINYLKQKNYLFEIIIVDDGSEDDFATESVAKNLNCIFLKNDKNIGKGAATKKGMLYAKGDIRIFTDADIPFDYDVLERFIYYLDTKEFDMVVGDRTLPGSNYFTEIPWARKIGSAMFSFIVGRFVAGGYFDTQCGVKGFRSDVANDLFSVNKINGFTFDVEIIYIALKRNYDIKRLPVTLRSQEGSSVSLLKHAFGMLLDLFKIKRNHVRGIYHKTTT